MHLVINKQPLAGGRFSTWIKLLIENRFRISIKYLPRAIYITIMTFFTSPFRMIEEMKYEKEFRERNVKPVFIIGHFRSGTTYLHYLMGKDKNFAYVSTFQTMVPGNFIFLSSFFKKLLSSSLPEKRPMDDVRMSADYPYEEEYGIGNLSTHSFYHGWYFPRKMREYFDKYVIFKYPSLEKKWKDVYSYFINKVSYVAGKDRVLLKNPPNTARIKQILDIYPEAKFIHIYRNPYEVFFSTKKLYEGIMPIFVLQNYDMKEIEENIFYFYRAMYEKFFREVNLIEEKNYTETRYEDFIKEPMKTLKKIYEDLNLPNFNESRDAFMNYILQQKNYRRRNYDIKEEDKERIYREWKLTIDEWGY